MACTRQTRAASSLHLKVQVIAPFKLSPNRSEEDEVWYRERETAVGFRACKVISHDALIEWF